MIMENFYYECIYEVLRNTYPHGQKMILLSRLKAKITNLKWNTLQRVILDNEDSNRLAGGKPALFHVPNLRKRLWTRLNRIVQDDYGNTQRTTLGIMREFTTFLRQKYEPKSVD